MQGAFKDGLLVIQISPNVSYNSEYISPIIVNSLGFDV
jgi:hypothetical protein